MKSTCRAKDADEGFFFFFFPYNGEFYCVQVPSSRAFSVGIMVYGFSEAFKYRKTSCTVYYEVFRKADSSTFRCPLQLMELAFAREKIRRHGETCLSGRAIFDD